MGFDQQEREEFMDRKMEEKLTKWSFSSNEKAKEFVEKEFDL